jgi:hypothetical protein
MKGLQLLKNHKEIDEAKELICISNLKMKPEFRLILYLRQYTSCDIFFHNHNFEVKKHFCQF